MYLFLKEISSDGDVQTVDVIYPFFPILLYMNPSWLKLMLDPLFINQEAGYWPFEYPIHDLGFYPNAVGHNDGNDEQQPLEEAGNMLIMTLAYSQRTGDTDYLTQHYDILNQWTQFLVQEALIPANQISTDDFAGSLANQTNLALKGIIGIQAMSVIANETGHASDGANFSSIAHSYIDQWQNLAIARNASPPHTTLAYGQENTHGKSFLPLPFAPLVRFFKHGLNQLQAFCTTCTPTLCSTRNWCPSPSTLCNRTSTPP